MAILASLLMACVFFASGLLLGLRYSRASGTRKLKDMKAELNRAQELRDWERKRRGAIEAMVRSILKKIEVAQGALRDAQ
jgi:hypothetical protein